LHASSGFQAVREKEQQRQANLMGW